MKEWSEDWDLTTIPDELFNSERGRRHSLLRKRNEGGRPPGCTCGKCRRCKARKAEAKYNKSRRMKLLDRKAS